MLLQKWSVLFFLAKSNLALFAPCGEPSVSALVKSSLDCRLSQWHIYLLESVLLLAGCCERVFLYHGVDSPVIHHCYPTWTSRPFHVAELTSAFFFFSECSCYLCNGFVLFLKPNNCFTWSAPLTAWCGSQQQLPNANGTLRINSRTCTCLIDVEIMKEWPTSVH